MVAPTTGPAVRKDLLFCLLDVWRPVAAQPQGDVGRLHRLPYYAPQVVGQCLQVRLAAEFHRKPLKGLGSVILPPVEAAVYEGVDAARQRSKQRRDQECGCDYCEGGLLARDSDEDTLQHHDEAEVEGDQRGGEGTVDEGSIDDEVYLVEPVAHYRYAYR